MKTKDYTHNKNETMNGHRRKHCMDRGKWRTKTDNVGLDKLTPSVDLSKILGGQTKIFGEIRWQKVPKTDKCMGVSLFVLGNAHPGCPPSLRLQMTVTDVDGKLNEGAQQRDEWRHRTIEPKCVEAESHTTPLKG